MVMYLNRRDLLERYVGLHIDKIRLKHFRPDMRESADGEPLVVFQDDDYTARIIKNRLGARRGKLEFY